MQKEVLKFLLIFPLFLLLFVEGSIICIGCFEDSLFCHKLFPDVTLLSPVKVFDHFPCRFQNLDLDLLLLKYLILFTVKEKLKLLKSKKKAK